MAKSLLRTDREIAEVYERNKKTVYRVCFSYMKNTADTEDAVQEVDKIRYILLLMPIAKA